MDDRLLKVGPLDHNFEAVLEKSPSPGGQTYVVLPTSAVHLDERLC
jgi:hypothetical protein